MAEKQSILEKIKQKIPLKKNTFIAICVGLICVIVLFFSFPKSKNKSQTNTNQPSTNYTFDALEYANQVSKNLQDIINNVSGITNAKVVVVVKQSPIFEYLTEKDNTDGSVVYYKNSSNYQPVVVTQFLPEIQGILIVAKGVSNLQIKNNLLNAVSAVYNLNISCIDILEGK